jgi:phage gpG-like protein
MITGYIIGDKALIARLSGAGAAVKAEIDVTVAKLGFQLQRKVQMSYLTGPRPVHLGVVHDRLRSSITQGNPESRSRFESTDTSAIAYVGTNVSYGALWEHGFNRKVGAGARGGPRTLSGKALDSYIRRHPPGVRPVAARPFLAPALFEMRAQIVTELGAGLKRGMERALRGNA